MLLPKDTKTVYLYMVYDPHTQKTSFCVVHNRPDVSSLVIGLVHKATAGTVDEALRRMREYLDHRPWGREVLLNLSHRVNHKHLQIDALDDMRRAVEEGS